MRNRDMVDLLDDEIDLIQYSKKYNYENPRIKVQNNKLVDVICLVSPSNEVIAYRFYLENGTYDIRKDVSIRYGFGISPRKWTQLYERRGIIATKKEFDTHKLIPDISNCVDDIASLSYLLELYKLKKGIR